MEDFEQCYRVLLSRDPRFDGWFFTAVTSTGIYCRPSCPARTPARRHVRFYPTNAAAQQAGFRACLRCHPDAVPGSPEWNARADVVARAMRLIADGVVDRDGVAGLAGRLGYGTRQLHRMLAAEVGAGPLALARAQRAQTARVLIETTELGMADVAFAAGFSSVRQFNDTVRHVLGRTPSELRANRQGRGTTPRARGTGDDRRGQVTIALRLPYRSPMAVTDLLSFLGARAVPGLESLEEGTFARSLRLPHGHGIVSLAPGDGHVAARLTLRDVRDLPAAVTRCRRLLDLDADPRAVDDALGEDRALGPLIRRTPGRRVPGAVDGFEIAVRAVVGQQVSVAGARTVAGRLVAAVGPMLDVAGGGALVRVFPSPGELLGAPPGALRMPAGRRDAILALARAVEGGELTIDGGTDRQELSARLAALHGVGPWTASYVSMRALGDPDAFMSSDLGVLRGLERLGIEGRPAAALKAAARWRPWRAYAMTHLWAIGTPAKEDAA